MSYAILADTVRTATFNKDNWNTNNSINWSFVDADAYAECFTMFTDTAEFYTAFDEICDTIIAEMREEALAEDALA